MADERSLAAARHPTARGFRLRVEPLASRVASQLRIAGARWPVVASAVLAARGATGLGSTEFAALVEVPVDDLVRLERDGCAPDELPFPLRSRVQGLL